MTTDKPLPLVPKLRFPEFRGAGEWDRRQLGDVLKVGYGRDYRHLAKGDVPVYGTGGYMVSVDAHLHDGESVCIGRKGTIDSPMLLDGRFWTTDTLFYTHSFSDCLPRFMYLVFQRVPWQNYNAASGVPSLSKTTIEEIVASLPELAEQSKITDCLGSLDDLIAAEGRKIEALRQHKQGLMQQLFPSPGETVPKLRFPEFRGAGEWDRRQLGDVLKVGYGRDYRHLAKGDVPVYGTGGYMVSVDAHLHDGESVCIGRKGTIDSPMLLDGRFWTTDTLFYTHSFSDCLPRFMYLVFQRVPWQNYNAASGVPSLSKTTIEEIVASLPELAEQSKITDCLGSLDDLIAAEGRKIEALRQHKQGLMQQLFPSLNEQ